LDLLLNPYGCIATGDEVGMIEVVLNARTTADINKAHGGTKAVLYRDTLTKWLRSHNTSDADFRKAQENFCISCAGYCVATFVLGVGDRHNDNIMVTHAGHLFRMSCNDCNSNSPTNNNPSSSSSSSSNNNNSTMALIRSWLLAACFGVDRVDIDFGHFLGNFKKKFGFKRERAPFVFTPQYAHVLGGTKHELFRMFVDTCCKAYNILRKHSDMFINLFQMVCVVGNGAQRCNLGDPLTSMLADALYWHSRVAQRRWCRVPPNGIRYWIDRRAGIQAFHSVDSQ
jgi:phosphatidylinositol-4,5-bisphosphate 3-kinase catalytic subunit alpha/beta/delta